MSIDSVNFSNDGLMECLEKFSYHSPTNATRLAATVKVELLKITGIAHERAQISPNEFCQQILLILAANSISGIDDIIHEEDSSEGSLPSGHRNIYAIHHLPSGEDLNTAAERIKIASIRESS